MKTKTCRRLWNLTENLDKTQARMKGDALGAPPPPHLKKSSAQKHLKEGRSSAQILYVGKKVCTFHSDGYDKIKTKKVRKKEEKSRTKGIK